MLLKNLAYEYQAFTALTRIENQHGRGQGWVMLSQAMAQVIQDVRLLDEMTQNQVMSAAELWKNVSGTYHNGVITGFKGASWQLLGLNTLISCL